MIKAVIFDFGGVLVRTEDYNARLAWDERLGLPPGRVEQVVHHSALWVQAQLGRITEDAYWQGIAAKLQLRDDGDIEQLRRDYFSGDRLNHQLVGLIRNLREAGYPIALLSNDSLRLESKLRELEIDTLFDHILISAQIGVMKPDPAAYRAALQALDVSSQDAVFIDDSLANIRGAQSLGIHAILFRPDTDLESELAPYLADAPGHLLPDNRQLS